MKYIVTTNCDNYDKEEIFIFNENIHHDCMAEAIEGIKNQSHGNWDRQYHKPIAAGFTDGRKCWGRSETLGLGSRGKVDSDLIK